MSKENKFDFNKNWYELWMKQSQEFFDSADQNLKDLFGKGAPVNPEEHLKQINQWMEALKHQWDFAQLTKEQQIYANYWKMMTKMFTDASDMLLEQWIKRSRDQHPIKNVRELYDLWLNCCSEIYKKSLTSKNYQDAYTEYMNAAFKLWKDFLPK